MDFLQELLKPEIIWIVVGIILLLVEFAAPGFIIGFFGIGAILTGIITAIFNISINTQIILFIIVSVILLLVLRKYLQNTFSGHVKSGTDQSDNDKEFIGEEAIVTEKIEPHLPGKVEMHGTPWKAVSDEAVAKGKPVTIIGKENITLKVKEIK